MIYRLDEEKVTCGVNGFLRQEFRELEILDEITRLRYEGYLPPQITGVNRRDLLIKYQNWKGGNYQPIHLHHAIFSYELA